MNRRAFIVSSGVGIAGLALAARGADSAPLAGLEGPLIAWVVEPLDGDPCVGATAPIVRALGANGYAVERVPAEQLAEALCGAGSRPDLLAIADAARLPAETVEPVTRFLRSGGACIVLNAPAWRDRRVQVDGRWTSAADLESALLRRPAPGGDRGAPPAVSGRDTYRADESGPQPIAACGGPHGAATGLAIAVDELQGWDEVTLDPASHPVVSGDAPITTIAVKGDMNTVSLAVRWRCRDGSVWSAVVPCGLEWRLYALAPSMFRHRYGGPEDAAQQGFDPGQAETLSLAQDHNETGRRLGPRRCCVALIGAAKPGSAYAALATGLPLPELETIAPTSKGYACDDVRVLRVSDATGGGGPFAMPSGTVWSPHVRPQAGGLGSGRNWRWMPLIEAFGANDDWRGAPATLACFNDGRFGGGVWASFGVDDPAWYAEPEVEALLGRVVRRMADGVFMLDGGADKYTYFEEQPLELGVRIAHMGSRPQTGLTANVQILDAATGATVHRSSAWSFDLAPGETREYAEPWRPDAWPEGGFRVRVDVMQGARRIDRVEHEAHVWRPPVQQRWVRTQDGGFTLDGEPWRVHAVNYFPASAVAIDDHAADGPGTFAPGMFEFWTRPDAYDPEIVQRDLERIKAMGFNAVSATLWCETSVSQNPLDFLRRAAALGLKVNLAIRYIGHTNLTYDWDAVKETVSRLRLWEHDAVFAVDVDWEPMFFPWLHARFAPGWEAWVVERYGSIENAERRWGVPICRDEDGAVKLYEPHMLDGDGPWRTMIAALRRYLDTVLYAHYSRVRGDIRTLLPNALVSFRMHSAGDPDFHWNQCFAFDFAYLGGAVDVFEPEGYTRKVSWDRMVPGLFTTAYAHWANPALPVFWAEAGTDAWIAAEEGTTGWSLAQQRRDVALFYRMLDASGGDGVAWWWWPGGCRYREVSDYGLRNPDGTDRPVSGVCREEGPRFLAGDAGPAPTEWVTFDRDRHVDGVRGIYRECADAFRGAADSGGRVALRTSGTGTDSRDCPAVAVGGAPWDGTDPPKYLDGFLDAVELCEGDGAFGPVAAGETVRVSGREPLRLRATVRNLGEATWLSALDEADAFGTVSLVAGVGSDRAFRAPMPRRIPRFEQVAIEVAVPADAVASERVVTISLEALGRTPFGPRYAFRITSV